MHKTTPRYRHPQDGPWAWLVLFAVWFANVTIMGFALTLGVLLPELREYFNKSRQSVGKCEFTVTFLHFLNTGCYAVDNIYLEFRF